MARINWGGSTVRYIAIGVVLLVVTAGAVIAVHKRGEVVRANQASQIAKANTKVVGVTSRPAVKSNSSQNQSASSGSATNTGPAPSELPKTGPTGIISQILGLGSLSVALVSYISSRKTRARSL